MSTSSNALPVHLAEPDRPFWGYADLLVAAAIFVVTTIIGFMAMKALGAALHFDPELGVPLLVVEFTAYAVVFLVLKALFARYGQPLFESLGWVEYPFRPHQLVVLGVVLAIVVVLLGALLRLPNVETPFDKLLNDLPSRIAISAFGTTLGPIIEELLFRGFLQPLLVDSFGVLPGILATSLVFGAMHLMQNANLWQSGVLITFVGFVLGVVRHVSGSTRASAITHVSYNALPFILTLIAGGK
jgi:uncharacterized protein